MAHRRAGVILCLSLLGLTLAGCGAQAPLANAKTVGPVVRAMINAYYPAVPFSQLAPSARLTPLDRRHLIRREKSTLADMMVVPSSAYRQALTGYNKALDTVETQRILQARVSEFQILSVTANANTASVEWSAVVQSVRAQVQKPGRWVKATASQHLEGTTVLRFRHHHWRVSSTSAP